MKLRDVLALIVLIAVALGGKLYRDGLDAPPPQRRPDPGQFRPPSPGAAPSSSGREVGPVLPPESARDPRLVVEVEDKTHPATGTAFSVNRSGVWITARHVTHGCELVALRNRSGRLVRVQRVSEQPDSDISILWTNGGAPALPLVDPELRIGQPGYSFGFPRGEPGDVYASLIGRGTMLARGRYNTEEPVVAWAQLRRAPDRGADLGGISGGPWVNAAGEVIGVHVAGAPRRGRSYSTAPRSIRTAVERTGILPQAGPETLPPGDTLSPDSFGNIGNALRRQLTVAQVI